MNLSLFWVKEVKQQSAISSSLIDAFVPFCTYERSQSRSQGRAKTAMRADLIFQVHYGLTKLNSLFGQFKIAFLPFTEVNPTYFALMP